MLLENIFSSLFSSPSYFKIVYPNLVEDYFYDKTQQDIFNKIRTYSELYNKQPSISDVKLIVESDCSITETNTDSINEFLDELKQTEKVADETLLIKQTEEFCQQRALEIAILESVEILKNNKGKGIIEDLVKKALAVEFDVKIGHDFFEEAGNRMKSYLEDEEKVLLDVELINEAMGGGLTRKSIFIFMANTNVGKTVWLCHCASSLLRSGKDVLYISGEMGFEEIGKRIDANILDIDISNLSNKLDKNMFKSKFKSVMEKTHGNLIIKEVAPGACNARHIANILNEIRLKKGYLPEVLVLDHLTLFASHRLPSNQTGSHLYVACVAEEIRAVAKEFNIIILTAAQFNRGAKDKNSDVGSEDVGLGYGISQTSDWSGAIIQTPELKEQNKYILKTIKTRFGSNNETHYTIGIDYSHMRLLNLEACDQEIPLHIKDKLKYEKKFENENPDVPFDFA
jgi:replicative DNA helicase